MSRMKEVVRPSGFGVSLLSENGLYVVVLMRDNNVLGVWEFYEYVNADDKFCEVELTLADEYYL